MYAVSPTCIVHLFETVAVRLGKAREASRRRPDSTGGRQVASGWRLIKYARWPNTLTTVASAKGYPLTRRLASSARRRRETCVRTTLNPRRCSVPAFSPLIPRLPRQGSVAAHGDRWHQFAHWAKAEGIKDLSKLDQQATAERYAQHVAARVQVQEIGIQYAQNLISTVNVTLAALRGDDRIRVSPAQTVGHRSQVRTQAPGSLDRDRVGQAAAALRAGGLERAAAVLELARDFGVRREEAVKADLNRWSWEVERHGAVNVQEGTKGGRAAPRWVPVNESARETLARALAARPVGSRNLIAPHETYAQVAIQRDSELNRARALGAVLGHWPDWEPHLRGPWTSPLSEASRRRPDRARSGHGGRPAKLARERSRQPRTTPGQE